MSGTSYDGVCPKCDGSMDCYIDWKPFDCVSHQCLNCGFYVYTADDRYTLDEVNDLRTELGMDPLIELKAWDNEVTYSEAEIDAIIKEGRKYLKTLEENKG